VKILNFGQAGLDRLKWAIDNAQALNADIICGPIHSPFAFSADNHQPKTKENEVQKC